MGSARRSTGVPAVRGLASLGAQAYGAGPEKVRLLAEYGHHLGMAFQLVDDMLGIWGETGTTGKPVAADLAARNVRRRWSPPCPRAPRRARGCGRCSPGTGISAPPISSWRPIWWSTPEAAHGPKTAPTCTHAKP